MSPLRKRKYRPNLIIGFFLLSLSLTACQGTFWGSRLPGNPSLTVNCPPRAISGEVLWTADLEAPLTGAPALDEEQLFIASFKGPYYSLDVETGEILWTKELEGFGSEMSPAVGSDGTVYFNTLGSGDNTEIDGFRTSSMKGMVALNPEDGRVEWTMDVDSGRQNGADGSPAVSPDGNTVLSSDVYNVKLRERGADISDPYTYAFDAEGNFLWKILNDGWAWSSPAVTDDKVFYGTTDSTEEKGADGYYAGTFRAVDLETGELLWEYGTPRDLNKGPALFVDSESGDLRIVAGDQSGQISIFDENGNVLVQREFYAAGLGSIIVGDTIYLTFSAPISASGAVNADTLFALDRSDLSTVWSYSFDNAYLTPALGNKAVYGVDEEGLFFALDPSTGEELWTVQTGPVEYGVVVLGKDGGAYTASSNGNLYKIQTESCGGYPVSAPWPSYRGAYEEANGQGRL